MHNSSMLNFQSKIGSLGGYQQLQALKQISKHGWVNNVVAEFVNSLSMTLCSLYIISLDMIVNYIVNSCNLLVFSLSYVTPTLNNYYDLI